MTGDEIAAEIPELLGVSRMSDEVNVVQVGAQAGITRGTMAAG
jgi:hypothetical protein